MPFDAHYFEKLAATGVRPPADATFRDIYRRNHWGGTVSPSGLGASPSQTDRLRSTLPALLHRLGVDTLLDLPCGDYSWMRLVDLAGISYIGADLLPEVIRPLQTAHTDSSHRFLVLDLTQDPLPQAGLILCRDCLVHLSFADIRRALTNVVGSGVPYLMTTTFPECEVNEDIVTGDWRPLNLGAVTVSFSPAARAAD